MRDITPTCRAVGGLILLQTLLDMLSISFRHHILDKVRPNLYQVPSIYVAEICIRGDTWYLQLIANPATKFVTITRHLWKYWKICKRCYMLCKQKPYYDDGHSSPSIIAYYLMIHTIRYTAYIGLQVEHRYGIPSVFSSSLRLSHHMRRVPHSTALTRWFYHPFSLAE